MIYCVSDIHGRIDLFTKLLDEISLASNDMLFVLGDTIDRGGGLAVLRKVMELQKAGVARFIVGDHEDNFLKNITVFDPNAAIALRENHRTNKLYGQFCNNLLGAFGLLANSIEYATNMKKTQLSCEAAMNLTAYRGYRTVKEYSRLSDDEQKELLRFIRDAPVYEDIEVSGKKYRLMHAGCNQKGETCLDIRQEFFMNKSPLKDRTIVFGHTTTRDIGIMRGTYAQPKVWFDRSHNNDKIAIDCGAPFYGGRLACLRLDDMKEFYIDNEMDLPAYVEETNDFAKIYGAPVNPDFAYIPVLEEAEAIVRSVSN